MQLLLTSNFPENACVNCSDKLENNYFYKQQLVRKQEELHKFLNRLSLEKDEETEHEEHLNDETIDEHAMNLIDGENNEFLEAYNQYAENLITDEGLMSEQQLIVESSEKGVRDELIYENVQPKLILSSKFILSRDLIRNFPEKITSELESPLIEVNDKIINKCDECKITFLSEGELKQHARDHDEKNEYKCKLCHINLKSKMAYENHVKDTHEKIFICPVCGKIYNEKRHLFSHSRSHNLKNKYKCTFDGCEKTFKHNHHLKNHMRVHEKISPFSCDECKATFRQKYALTLHKRKHSSNFIECELCKSQFLRPSQLLKHKTTCDGTFKPYTIRKPKIVKTG